MSGAEQKMRTIMKRVEERKAQSEQKRIDDERALEAQGYDREIIADIKQEAAAGGTTANAKQRNGLSSMDLEQIGQQSLFELERRGDFTLMPLRPGTEYPLLLTRAPIFPPRKKSKIRDMLDDELSITFETSWAKARKFGPPTTVYDEDTLLALAGLRQQKISGLGHKLPIKVTNVLSQGETTRVHSLYTTVREVEEFLEKSIGGSGHKRRLESIHRLSAVRILFTRISDRTADKLQLVETAPMSIIDVRSVEEGDETFLYIQFPPAMALWLEESHAYIDLKVRKQLTDNGKAIHRYLSGQPSFNLSVEKLMSVTGTGLPKKRFMKELRDTLATLESIGWCESEILGTGRKTPFILKGRRTKRKKD